MYKRIVVGERERAKSSAREETDICMHTDIYIIYTVEQYIERKCDSARARKIARAREREGGGRWKERERESTR